MGDIKVNWEMYHSEHPDTGAYSRDISLHHGNTGLSRTWSYGPSTKSQWTALWDAAITGGTTWDSAASTWIGSAAWAALPSDAKTDVRERVSGRS